MSNRLLPLNDTDFWWLRYFCGVALPVAFALGGVISLVTRHSYAVWAMRRYLRIVPVHGEQALLMGGAYLGLALALYANCYLQYHEKWAYYYQWPLSAGVLLAGAGVLWCSWIFLIG